MKNAAILLLLLGVFLLLEAPAFSQCAMCRTALESSPEGQAMAGSFRQGILLLMGVPYLIFGTIGFALFRASRKGGEKIG